MIDLTQFPSNIRQDLKKDFDRAYFLGARTFKQSGFYTDPSKIPEFAAIYAKWDGCDDATLGLIDAYQDAQDREYRRKNPGKLTPEERNEQIYANNRAKEG